ncbi:MAG: EscU/YscU/HrcU family type III secretion system export apparatus switch protein [Pseudomonadota bacterium]
MSRSKSTRTSNPSNADANQRAVALQYDGVGAPRVVATGRGLVAAEIRRIAEAHDVPLRDDAVLVEALSTVALGEEIPEALYVAMAEVLAFTYRLQGRNVPGPNDPAD